MSTFSIVTLSVVVLVGFLIFTACSPFTGPVNEALSDSYYYNRNKTAIQYSPMGNWFELGNSKMTADVTSFEVLGQDFAKDKDKIYFKDSDITDEADHATFRVVDYTAYDKDHVYVANIRNVFSEEPTPTNKLLKLEGANPASYELIDYDWSKDDKHYFYNYKLVDVDYASFEILNEVCSKDKDKVYLHTTEGLVASTIDVASVKAIDASYMADKDNLYSFSKWAEEVEVALVTIPLEDIETIAILKHSYLLVDDGVYYDNILMPMADRATFKLWADTYYGVDKNHVYFSEKPIEGADVNTFHVFEYQAYTKDKNNAYYNGKVIAGVDLESFGPKEKGGFGLFEDKYNTYNGNEIVTE